MFGKRNLNIHTSLTAPKLSGALLGKKTDLLTHFDPVLLISFQSSTLPWVLMPAVLSCGVIPGISKVVQNSLCLWKWRDSFGTYCWGLYKILLVWTWLHYKGQHGIIIAGKGLLTQSVPAPASVQLYITFFSFKLLRIILPSHLPVD